MPRGKKSDFSFAGQLSKMVEKLKEQRRTHAEALSSIDDIFAKIGITTHLAEPEATPRRGRPPGRKPGKRGPGRPKASAVAGGHVGSSATKGKKKGKRGSYATSANESILAFVKEGGAKGRTTAEINSHFKSEGRSGNAYVALGKLAKAKKLKRKNMPGERGSRYTAG
jgi:hypothetical protein